MAGLNDILTTAQNVASAINNIAQTYLNVQGSQTKADITADTLVLSNLKGGRLANVVVINGGSADGAVYDANDVTLTTNQVFLIPQTKGVYVVNVPVQNGIVVAPGTGQQLAVSYSANPG